MAATVPATTSGSASGQALTAAAISSMPALLSRGRAESHVLMETDRIQLIEAWPSDGASRGYADRSVIQASVDKANQNMADKTDGLSMKFSTEVVALRLPYTDADIRARPNGPAGFLANYLYNTLHFDDANYLMYYEGSKFGSSGTICGHSWSGNAALPIKLGVVTTGCADRIDFADLSRDIDHIDNTALHEAGHTLAGGTVAPCAPHEDRGHVNDSTEDAMAAHATTFYPEYDINGDDYLNKNHSALGTCTTAQNWANNALIAWDEYALLTVVLTGGDGGTVKTTDRFGHQTSYDSAGTYGVRAFIGSSVTVQVQPAQGSAVKITSTCTTVSATALQCGLDGNRVVEVRFSADKRPIRIRQPVVSGQGRAAPARVRQI